MAKTLMAFFSRADENYFGGSMRYIEVGNTEVVARKIKDMIEADLFKIEMKTPYAKDYNTCIAEAKEHQKQDARPELKSLPTSIDAYDTVILGYPNYWGTMPMAAFTFLEAFDFSGKTILPLCTNEGRSSSPPSSGQASMKMTTQLMRRLNALVWIMWISFTSISLQATGLPDTVSLKKHTVKAKQKPSASPILKEST